MKNRLAQIALAFALRVLTALAAPEGPLPKTLRFLAAPLRGTGRMLFKYGFVPLYAVGYALKRAVRRVVTPAKNRFMFLMANRYLAHGLIIAIALVTSAVSLRAREVRAENLGEQSLLFRLVRGEDYGLTEEVAVGAVTRPVSYFEPLAVEAGLDLDDIGPEDADLLTAGGGLAVVQPTLTDTDVTPIGTRTKTESYVVAEGDTLSGIAKRFGVSINTILWENGLTPRDLIRPGQSLRILPVSGLAHTVKSGDTLQRIAARYGISADDIVSANQLASADDLRIGEKLIVPGGTPPTPVAPAAPPRQVASVRQILTVDRSTAAPAPSAAQGTARMVWPTAWRIITQYYGWRHTGIDIDGDYTTPIYAADGGIVTHAGWGRTTGGYGIYVDIDNGGGIKTRYAHASKLFVNVGDQVTKGQSIAMVGTTGRSTGTHLHFEVMVNGKFTNPLQWIR